MRAVLASLVKGRWPSAARTEGLFRREMPLTEGSARFGGAPGGGILPEGNPPVCGLPGAAFCRKAIPQSAGFARSQPPLTRGPNRCAFYARRETGACGGGGVRGRIWNPPLQNGAFPRAAFGGGAIPPAALGARPPPFDKGGKLRPGIKFCAASFLTTRNMVYWTGSYKNLI